MDGTWSVMVRVGADAVEEGRREAWAGRGSVSVRRGEIRKRRAGASEVDRVVDSEGGRWRRKKGGEEVEDDDDGDDDGDEVVECCSF